MSKAPPTVKSTLKPLVRETLRKEFSSFFTHMLTPQRGWPAIPHEEFVNALADSILTVGKESNNGIAMLQTLTYELQERINHELKG